MEPSTGRGQSLFRLDCAKSLRIGGGKKKKQPTQAGVNVECEYRNGGLL